MVTDCTILLYIYTMLYSIESKRINNKKKSSNNDVGEILYSETMQ